MKYLLIKEKRPIKIFFCVLLLLSLLFIKPRIVSAENSCSNFEIVSPSSPLVENTFSQIYFRFKTVTTSKIRITSPDSEPYKYDSGWLSPNDDKMVNPKAIDNKDLIKEGTYYLYVYKENTHSVYCTFSYTVLPATEESKCFLSATSTGTTIPFRPDSSINISVNNTNILKTKNTQYLFVISQLSPSYKEILTKILWDKTPNPTNIGQYSTGRYKVSLSHFFFEGGKPLYVEDCRTVVFDIKEEGGGVLPFEIRPTETIQRLCQEPLGGICTNCLKEGKTWTALGCIPTNDLNEFIKWFLGKIIYIASGIAFLIMVFGAFQIITSSGNPERIQAGKEVITSAVSGLLFIILSLFLLKLIGVDILHIPGFGE